MTGAYRVGSAWRYTLDLGGEHVVEEGGDPRYEANVRSVGAVLDTLAGTTRAGVYDAPLLHRMQKLVAVLPASDLLHVDFGEIAHAPPGFHAGAWPDLFGAGVATPAIANYLFSPQPTTMISTTLIGSRA